MALIKDKYSKLEKSRSKYVLDRKVVRTPEIAPTYKTTEQKLSDAAKIRRAQTEEAPSSIENVILEEKITSNNLTGRILSTANTTENIFILDEGSALKDIILNHYHGSGTSSVISLHWSFKPIEDLTFTVSSGVITAVSGGVAYRLFTDTFVSQSTLSLASSGLFNTFENINRAIYFYAVCSVLGPTFTIVKE
jgi:hypothetical protein